MTYFRPKQPQRSKSLKPTHSPPSKLQKTRTSLSLSDDGWSLSDRDPDFIRSILPYSEWFYQYYFQVKSDGWENIPDGPVLFVGAHNGGLASPDLHMFMVDWFRRFGVERRAYGLMHPKMWTVFPHLAQLATRMGAVQAHPKMAIAALKQGASVLVYPGGAQDVFRPYQKRHQICLNGRQGFIKLALRQTVPIVPLISTGAHETLFVLDNCYEQAKRLHEMGMPWLFNIDPEVFPIYFGWPWGLSVGPMPNIPWPSPIRLQVCPPIRFERYGRDALKNKDYVAQCYQTVETQMQRHLDALATKRR